MTIKAKREVSMEVCTASGGTAFLDLVANRSGVELRHVKWVTLNEHDIESVVTALRQAWQAHLDILNTTEKP